MRELEVKKESIQNPFATGYESVIYKYFDPTNYDDVVLYKKFNTFEHTNPNFLENKKQKLLLIPEIEELKDDVKVLDLLYTDGIFTGYTMEKSENDTLNIFDKKKVKIRLLKMIRDRIELLNSKGIYIGDFNERNFLTSKDKNIIQLCDLDNLRIKEFDFDVCDNIEKRFLNKCGNLDAIDSYCFNIFTIAFLGKYDISYLSDYFTLEHVHKCLLTKENEEIINSMIFLNSNYKKGYLIDNIKTKSLF